jgi:hypothetical protein
MEIFTYMNLKSFNLLIFWFFFKEILVNFSVGVGLRFLSANAEAHFKF